MGKLIQRIKQSFGYARTLGRSHPVTFVVLILDTIVFTVLALTDGLLGRAKSIKDAVDCLEEMSAHAGLWFFMLLFAVFLMENILAKNKLILRIMITSVAAIVTYFLSALVVGTWFFKDTFSQMAKDIGNERLEIIVCGYFTVISVLIVFFCYQRNKDRFALSEYLMGVISGSFLISVIYAVVNIGLLTLTFVFTELLFGRFEDIFLPLFVLITGLYYGGALISVIANSEKEVPKFIIVLFRYVLFGMALAAYVIVYLYIIKIVFLSGIPSNSVYAILTSLFCFSIPLAYLNSYLDEGFFGRISKILPYIFAPLIILQTYTVAVRIGQYGLTESRYLGVIFICVEVMYIIWYAIKRDSIKYIFVGLAVLAFFMTIMPGTNALSVPRSSQKRTFAKLISVDVDDLSKKQTQKLLAAYDYIRCMDGGEDYLEDNYSKKELEAVKELGAEKGSYHNSNIYIDYRCRSSKLDVSDYDSIYVISVSEYRGKNYIPIDEMEMKVKELGSGNTADTAKDVIFDATRLVKLLMSDDYDDNRDEYEATPIKFERSGQCFVITKASLSYDEITEEIQSLSIDGYLLR